MVFFRVGYPVDIPVKKACSSHVNNTHMNLQFIKVNEIHKSFDKKIINKMQLYRL